MNEADKLREITSANREAWEEAAPIHAKHNQESLVKIFSEPGHSCLNEIEMVRLEALDFRGKSVAQVCCNNGREIISVKNMGAGRCVGFDGAKSFLEQARELASAAGQDVEFVCCDIYDIDESYYAAFDIVTITIGVVSWMPDVDRFFAVPKEHLSSYSGWMHADGYAGFEDIYNSGRIGEVACMAHVRRKFVDLHKSQGLPVAEEAIKRIAFLYAIEKEARGSPPEDRVAIRQTKAKPIFDDLEIWLVEQLPKLSGKSPLAKDIRYALSVVRVFGTKGVLN
jgi:hypothetical protein